MKDNRIYNREWNILYSSADSDHRAPGEGTGDRGGGQARVGISAVTVSDTNRVQIALEWSAA